MLHCDAITCAQKLYHLPARCVIVWGRYLDVVDRPSSSSLPPTDAATPRTWNREHMLHVMQDIAKLVE